MMRPALPLLATAALILVGCGGGDDDPTTEARSPSTTTATGPASTATTPATTSTAAQPVTTTAAEVEPAPVGSKKEEQAIAKAGLLVQADLPGTWKVRKGSGGDDGIDGPCPAITAAKRATSARAKTPTFELGDDSVGSVVYLYETPAQALRQLESINTDVTRDCIVEQTLKPIRAAAKKAGATLGTARTSTPPMTGGSGPQAFRVAVPISADGRTDELTVSVGSSRVGRGLALLALVGVDDTAQQRLMTTAVRRLTDAQAVGP